MAVNPSPWGPKPQIELSTGLPAVGGQLFFYVAGSTSTKQNTYTDSTGGVANTNPVILDANGFPTNTQIWFTAGQSYKVVYAPAGDTDPPSSPIWTIDNLRGQNDTTSSVDQWVSSGITPTYVSGTSFTMAGDQTTAFHVGRRLKLTVTAGTVYGTIATSVFGALTTVTMTMDGASVLDSGLSAVSLGLLTATSVSIPNFITAGTGISVTYSSGKPTIAATASAVTGALLGFVNFTAQTVALSSISNATPAVFTVSTAQQLPEVGSPLQLTTSGSLPTGLSLATTYWVTNASGTTFNVTATYADALAGTNKIATSSAGSGTHTINSVYPKTGLFGTPSFVEIEVWGAGGGGGGVNATNGACGEGGGAGGYSRRKVSSASLAATETVTIGAGGTAGANTGGTGGTGGTTSFGSWASATGGGGGAGSTSAAAFAPGTGGLGASGDLNLQGMCGFAGNNANGAGGASGVASGAGGSTNLGGNALPVAGTTNPGNNGRNNSGSGASGALGATANIGGIGGSGRVIVREYS